MIGLSERHRTTPTSGQAKNPQLGSNASNESRSDEMGTHDHDSPRELRRRRLVTVTANQLSLAELRAYARRTGGPDTFDRDTLIKHVYNVHNRRQGDDGPDYDPDNPATFYDYNFNYQGP